MQISVFGSGRWGCSIALYCHTIGHKVTVHCSRESSYNFIKQNNYSSHLPDYKFPQDLQVINNSAPIPQSCQLAIFAIPTPFFRKYLENIKGLGKQILLTVNKGIEQKNFKTPPEILKEFFPDNVIAHLGGPCFPNALLKNGNPAAETLACEDQVISKKLQKELSSKWFRIYQSQDLKGTAFLGALKNIFAIIAGIIQGYQLGEEAMSILITRGIVEIKRIHETLNLPINSIYGLSGLGDLTLTCYSQSSSQNKNFGYQIGKGENLDSIIEKMQGKIAEGYYTTKAVFDIIQNNKINAPLIETLYRILYQKMPLNEALHNLITRPLQIEN